MPLFSSGRVTRLDLERTYGDLGQPARDDEWVNADTTA